MSNVKIIAAFGSFIVDLGKPQPSIFATEQEAINALAIFENSADYLKLANGYCAYAGYTGKNAAGKVNVITSFLVWVDAGMPAPAADAATSADVGLYVDQTISDAVDAATSADVGLYVDQTISDAVDAVEVAVEGTVVF